MTISHSRCSRVRLFSASLPGLTAIALLLVWGSGFLQPTAYGQEWVKAMFEETSHDFGTVPRGADAEFAFKLKNKYEETVHIDSVRSSCGCTRPRIVKQDLKTYEEGSIVCEFNTRSFIGKKSAVVTVVFTQPFYGEMQLNVQGNIRSDIVTEPGKLEFGEVRLGEEKTTELRISYAGQNAWKIVDVRSANKHLGVGGLSRSDSQGRIAHQMSVRLKDSAPAGEFNDQIVLVTNESRYNLVTIPVTGMIVPPLVMPVTIDLGSIPAGKSAATRMVIKGEQPFRITEIECGDPRFSFTKPSGTQRAHIIPVEFAAGKAVGGVRRKVTVKTDLESGQEAATTLTVNVVQ